MSEGIHNPELTAVEQALSALAPRPGDINRDQLMFRAGQAAPRPRAWAWPGATAALTALAATLAVALLVRPAPQTVIVQVPVDRWVTPPPKKWAAPVPQDTAEVPPEDVARPSVGGDYLKLRDQVLCQGLDALPHAPPPPPLPPLDLQQLLDVPSGMQEQAPSSSPSFIKQGERS